MKQGCSQRQGCSITKVQGIKRSDTLWLQPGGHVLGAIEAFVDIFGSAVTVTNANTIAK